MSGGRLLGVLSIFGYKIANIFYYLKIVLARFVMQCTSYEVSREF